MNRAFRISFSLKNTYRVNSIIYAFKQIPIIKKMLPQTLYQSGGLKVFGNVLAILWEIGTIFIGKLLYFFYMIIGMGMLYGKIPLGQAFLHILLFLTAIGAFANTSMFNPTRDKYYAMILMRMDAKAYTLSNYMYEILKILIGFLLCALIFGRGIAKMPMGVCLLIPLAVAGSKIMVASSYLWDYEKNGKAHNDNQLGKFGWIVMGLFLAAAYGLPVLGVAVPSMVVVVIMVLVIIAGIVSLRKIIRFPDYRDMYQQILAKSAYPMEVAKQQVQKQSRDAISSDVGITSNRKGFEYLNELFIKRHQKILWKSSKRITMISLTTVAMMLLACYLQPAIGVRINRILMSFLPYFVFVLYMINRGTGFTQALFMNCDRSLLTYSFYKQPKMILHFFTIRLREIVKVNLLPATVIGGGLAVLLYVSGGTDNPMNYVVIVVSILCMSIFFSVHYLTIYYLLQPYTVGTEIKSGTYKIIIWMTYIVCYVMMRVRMPTLVFGAACIVFCVLYCIIACVLVYRKAPHTFKIRS